MTTQSNLDFSSRATVDALTAECLAYIRTIYQSSIIGMFERG
jgi:hypothetical protein